MNLQRYHRQMLLPQVGKEGQTKLAQSTALIVGCGALGCVSSDQLARAGVGRILLADRDVVELTNLQRQTLYAEADAHESIPKAAAAAKRLQSVNSDIELIPIIEDVTHTNIESLMGRGPESRWDQPIDIVIDGTDNYETRMLIDEACQKYATPWVYGGAVGMTGSAMVILPDTPDSYEFEPTAKLSDLLEILPSPGQGPTCDTVGVLSPVVGMIANYQAAQALQILLDAWDHVDRSMLQIDLAKGIIRQVDVSGFRGVSQNNQDPDQPFPHLAGKFAQVSTSLCGRNAVQFASRRDHALDLESLATRLKSHGPVKHNELLIRSLVKDHDKPFELTIFNDGRAIVRGTTDIAEAKSIYTKYLGG